jgi:AcrR family transcriptional regulator
VSATTTADRPATAQRRSQADRRAISDARILRAATELFAEQGSVRTTLNEVGARAGYTGGLVSSRFGSKAGLVRAVLDDIYRRFRRETLDQMHGLESVVDRLSAYLRVFLDRLAEPRSDVSALYVVMGEAMGAVPDLRLDVGRFMEQTVGELAGLIERGVARGELRADLEPVHAATLLVAMLRGITIDRVARPEMVPPKNLEGEVLRVISCWATTPEEARQ